MMLMYGIELEQNPIARSIFHVSGPFGLIAANFGVVVSRVALLVRLARAGRPRLARNALVLVVMLGLLGRGSNFV